MDYFTKRKYLIKNKWKYYGIKTKEDRRKRQKEKLVNEKFAILCRKTYY
jgi:hypothetical protein